MLLQPLYAIWLGEEALVPPSSDNHEGEKDGQEVEDPLRNSAPSQCHVKASSL
jgi:hypothetical protein